MTDRQRAIIDTSTLLGALLRPNSVPRQAMLKVMDTHDLCMSKHTLDELRMVVKRPKFDPYLSLPDRLLFVETLTASARFWEVDSDSERLAEGVCRYPKDAKFLALALACQAAHLISSDADLLVLHPWQGIPILTPAQFLQSAGEQR